MVHSPKKETDDKLTELSKNINVAADTGRFR